MIKSPHSRVNPWDNMDNTKFATLHLYVAGRVQGVGFRFFALNRAKRYGITGWVKNLYDGRVEIEAEGRVPNLHIFLKDIKSGPSMSHVSNVVERWHETPRQRYSDFSVTY